MSEALHCIGVISVYLCYSTVPSTGTKEPYVLATSKALVGTFIKIGDITDLFPILLQGAEPVGTLEQMRSSIGQS